MSSKPADLKGKKEKNTIERKKEHNNGLLETGCFKKYSI